MTSLTLYLTYSTHTFFYYFVILNYQIIQIMIKKITIALLFFCLKQSYSQNTYYFSSSTGNDSNVGNEAGPFQTISKLNSLVLVAGDKILFKKGDTFIGQILVSYSGTIGFPIIYDSYGTGVLPLLTASNGSNGIPDPLSTIRILGKQYLEFHNYIVDKSIQKINPRTIDRIKISGATPQRINILNY